ncbi:MAG: sigma-70 family RNA polymerase sigma factor [Planctomycetaceae bacterium]|nr:sigma-70 family RNA polymerase sigma factor [Planctomycetaceae bacterium]
MPIDDQGLINAIAAGSREAFECVYHAHKDRLLTATAVLLHGDRAVAEDVLHEVYMQLLEDAGSIRLKGALRNYLITCCLNRARDLLRREASYVRIVQHVVNRGSNEVNSSNMLDSQEQQAKLMGMLSQLPDEQREVVTLHLHGDMTFQEVASVLDISVNTAKSRYRYAIEKLRQWANIDRVDIGGK